MRNLFRALAALAALAIVTPAFAADSASSSTDTHTASKTHKKTSKKTTKKHTSSKDKAGTADTSATPK